MPDSPMKNSTKTRRSHLCNSKWRAPFVGSIVNGGFISDIPYREQFRQEIMGAVTIRDVARLAGVSVSTVSQVLNGKGRISEKTRFVVEQAFAELDYIPNSRAQTMRSEKSDTVGLLIPDITNSYFAKLVNSAQNQLYEYGFSTLVGVYSDSADRFEHLLKGLLSQQVDGAIVVPIGSQSKAISLLQKNELPLVFVDRGMGEVDGVPLIDSNPEPGIQEAVTDINLHGHKRIGYISGPPHISPVFAARRAAFSSIAETLYNKTDLWYGCMDPENSWHENRDVIHQAIDAGSSAILFDYSPSTITALGIMQSEGIVIGKEISLVSFDDISVFLLTTPRISAISQQVERMGRKSAITLVSMIQNSHIKPESEHIPTVYISRDSVGVRHS